MDRRLAQKALIDVGLFIVCMLVMVFWIFPQLSKRAASESAESFWTTERRENAKRLFGDAWEESL